MRAALVLSLLLVVPNLACGGAVGSPCEDDSDCRRALVCWEVDDAPIGRQCTSPCEGKSECDAGEACVFGLCRVECEGAEDPICESGTTCVRDLCRLTCQSDADCRPGFACPSPGGVCE